MPEDPPPTVEEPVQLEEPEAPDTGVGLDVFPALGSDGRLIGAEALVEDDPLIGSPEFVSCVVEVVPDAGAVPDEVTEPARDVVES